MVCGLHRIVGVVGRVVWVEGTRLCGLRRISLGFAPLAKLDTVLTIVVANSMRHKGRRDKAWKGGRITRATYSSSDSPSSLGRLTSSSSSSCFLLREDIANMRFRGYQLDNLR